MESTANHRRCRLPALGRGQETGIRDGAYVVGFFHKGPHWIAEQTDDARRMQESHLANFQKLAEAGKLIVAGPFSDNGDLLGMLIFKLESVDEARKLMDADPTLKPGRLALDLHPGFAAAGLRVDMPKSVR